MNTLILLISDSPHHGFLALDMVGYLLVACIAGIIAYPHKFRHKEDRTNSNA